MIDICHVHIVPYHYICAEEMADVMENDVPWKKSLRIHQQGLRTGIIVRNFLPSLCELPMTEIEYKQVEEKTDNMSQVDELVKILLTKTEEHFKKFCSVLEQNDYGHWARKLRESEDLVQTLTIAHITYS